MLAYVDIHQTWKYSDQTLCMVELKNKNTNKPVGVKQGSSGVIDVWIWCTMSFLLFFCEEQKVGAIE